MHVGVELAARHIVDEMRADGHRGVCDFGIECVHRDQHIPKRHVARQRPVMHKGERPTVRIQGSVLYDIASTRQQLAMAMCVLMMTMHATSTGTSVARSTGSASIGSCFILPHLQEINK